MKNRDWFLSYLCFIMFNLGLYLLTLDLTKAKVFLNHGSRKFCDSGYNIVKGYFLHRLDIQIVKHKILSYVDINFKTFPILFRTLQKIDLHFFLLIIFNESYIFFWGIEFLFFYSIYDLLYKIIKKGLLFHGLFFIRFFLEYQNLKMSYKYNNNKLSGFLLLLKFLN